MKQAHESPAGAVEWPSESRHGRRSVNLGWGLVAPNLLDYEAACRSFSWEAARRELDGLPEGQGLNIAHEAVDRHADGDRASRVAIRWLGRHGERLVLTYRELRVLTSRFANVLQSLGVQPGETVFILADRIPELYVAALGSLKHRNVVSPLFSAFGPEPVRQRMTIGKGRVLVTTAALYRKRIAPIRDQLADLKHVIVVAPAGARIADTLDYSSLMALADSAFAIPPTRPDDIALLHFTSGTTGTPKGALHVHDAVVAHHATGTLALDFHESDVFWCTADPGWVTGMSYGIISPLTPWPDDGGRRARLRRGPLVPGPPGRAGERLVHRANSDSDADEGGRGAGTKLRPGRAPLRRERRRSTQSRSGRLGARGTRAAHSRQLVADGDGRDHDRELREHGDPPGLDGEAAAGD